MVTDSICIGRMYIHHFHSSWKGRIVLVIVVVRWMLFPCYYDTAILHHCIDVLLVQLIVETMNALENVFRVLYCKGDGSVPTHVPASVCMHTSALSAWTLLLSTLSTSVLRQFLDKYVCTAAICSCTPAPSVLTFGIVYSNCMMRSCISSPVVSRPLEGRCAPTCAPRIMPL